MMIPEAWERHETMDPAKRAFYRFHASLMEPWDGPASIAFTDGTLIGAVLDRNGLRPSRYWVTDDDLVVMASEAGVIDIPPTGRAQGRLQPGRMFLVDTVQGRIVDDTEIKATLAAAEPYEEWLHAGVVELADLPEREHVVYSHGSVRRRQQVFGYTHEELKIILAPMARTGAEPVGSMGTDTPIAVLSDRPRLLFDYFSQLFAQVTNPPLDAIREELVTALGATIGPEHNLLDPGPASCRQIVLPFPSSTTTSWPRSSTSTRRRHAGFQAATVSGLFAAGGGPALRRALDAIRSEVSHAIADGAHIIVLSDRNSDDVYALIPSLLLTSAAPPPDPERTRTRPSQCGDACEVHHGALSATAPAPSTRTWRSSPSRT
jgi:glutamate synthase (NADPH/NADH) large chain